MTQAIFVAFIFVLITIIPAKSQLSRSHDEDHLFRRHPFFELHGLSPPDFQSIPPPKPFINQQTRDNVVRLFGTATNQPATMRVVTDIKRNQEFLLQRVETLEEVVANLAYKVGFLVHMLLKAFENSTSVDQLEKNQPGENLSQTSSAINLDENKPEDLPAEDKSLLADTNMAGEKAADEVAREVLSETIEEPEDNSSVNDISQLATVITNNLAASIHEQAVQNPQPVVEHYQATLEVNTNNVQYPEQYGTRVEEDQGPWGHYFLKEEKGPGHTKSTVVINISGNGEEAGSQDYRSQQEHQYIPRPAHGPGIEKVFTMGRPIFSFEDDEFFNSGYKPGHYIRRVRSVKGRDMKDEGIIRSGLEDQLLSTFPNGLADLDVVSNEEANKKVEATGVEEEVAQIRKKRT